MPRKASKAVITPSFLFGDDRIGKAVSGRSEYAHTFGGPLQQKGTSREECQDLAIHLLHRLDLTDPAIPTRIPGVRWLPLYYCFDFRVDEIGYRLISDDKLEMFFPRDDPNVSEKEEWPDDDYPPRFRKRPVKVSPRDYDPLNIEDAFFWAGIFGIEKLKAHHREATKDRIIELLERLDFETPESDEELEEMLEFPFMQGIPNDPCLNPGCANHHTKGQLQVIALVPAEPVSGVHLFGEWGDGVRLIFQMCPKCYTIRVKNECD